MISASRLARFGVLDRDHRLDPPVEIAVHQVGRADVPVGVATVREAPDPGVLEELADDRADRDPLRDALDARQQRARAAGDDVDRTPARDARYRASIEGRSTIALSFTTIRASWPSAACSISRSTSSRNRDRRLCGATSSRRNVRWRDRPVSTLNRSVTSAPSSGPAAEQAEVRVQPGRPVVVVAGPDVDVAAQAGALAPDDETDLRVGLQADEAVDDVGARLLELAGPDDVRLLVEAGLDLDEDDHLLAALGGPDQVADDRRIAATSGRGSS